jgi:long-chain acyl-CoA synthetase
MLHAVALVDNTRSHRRNATQGAPSTIRNFELMDPPPARPTHDHRPLSAATALEAVLSERPDAEAVVARSGRLTYRQLDQWAERSMRALIAAGVRPGDRLGVSLTNDLPLVALFHAAMRLGAIWVGVQRALAPPEKAYLLADSQTGLFVGDAETVDQVRQTSGDHPVTRCVVVDQDPRAEWAMLLDSDGAGPLPAPDPLAPAAIAYTSGTTGFPKGAVHSQHNLMVPGRMIVRSRGYGPTLRKADCFPLTILNLQVLSTLLVAQCGGAAIVMDRVDPAGIAQWIEAERATTWNGAPAMLYGLAADDDTPAASLRSLDDVWSGGSHCPQATRDRFTAKFGLPVHTTYGATEVPTVVTIAPRGRAIDPGASGLPLLHLALHIVDDDGTEQRAGASGEICVGPADHGDLAALYQPMLGYWGKPEASAQAVRNGILHTGDVGFLDDEGCLHVQDRRQSLIVRGSANVYPAEVERVLDDFPAIAGSCVIGVADDRLGARVVAAVELDGSHSDDGTFDTDALRAHCLVNLARYKVPERFLVRTLPRNAMGKVSRPEVSRWFGAPEGG